MTLAQLESLKSALTGNAGINGMVDGKIYKFRTLEKSEPDLRSAVHKSLISCEVGDWAGGKHSSDPVFIVDIRSRQGTDGGAEYCSEIAKAVKELLDDGFSGVAVSQIRGEVKFEKALVAYRCRLEVFCHIKIAYSLSLYPSVASPKVAASEIVFTAIASPSQGIEYRFLLNGPGTGAVIRDLSGWQSRNSFVWRTTTADIGTSTIYVEIRGGLKKGVADQSTSIGYIVTAASTGSAPTITSLTPSLSSPREEHTKVDFICVASDADSDSLFYRFFLTGPGTASKKKLVQDWSKKNAWQWQPLTVDVGSSTIEVQIRDGLHAAEGSYDDSETVSYTITAFSVGSAPTVTSLTPHLASSQPAQTLISFICVASDADSDQILYRFYLTGPGTASKKKLVQDWGKKNFWEWNSRVEDVGTSTIEVQIRDGLHAADGSYDATSNVSYTITAISTGTAPTITSLTTSLISPQTIEKEIELTATVLNIEGDALTYKFLHQQPLGHHWILRSSAADYGWYSVCYGNGIFVATSLDGGVMTSPNGTDWTVRTSAASNSWYSVCYGNGLFVAVAISGTGNRVMTSTNGADWTIRTSAADNNWLGVCYGNGLFVAVAWIGPSSLVMTSPNGIDWTLRTAPAKYWRKVCYGNGIFVAVAFSGDAMTSSNGVDWTLQTTPALNQWSDVCYGNGRFVAVSFSGTGNRVMTSLNGINWTIRTSAADNDWVGVCYANGLFVAVAYSGTGNRVMTSPNGIDWTLRASAADNYWVSVCSGNGLLVAVSSNGIGNRVMTSLDQWKDLTGWSAKNSVTWKPTKEDIGLNRFMVYVRDGLHAAEGSYDDSETVSFTVIAAGTAPTITDVYVNEPGNPFVGNKIHIVANATDTDGDQILYKFWLYRETVGASWEQLTGWQTENWVAYTLDRMDYETITIKCQVRDGKHAGEESFDAEADAAITVQRAAITSVTPSLASPQAHENTIVFSVLANKTSKIYYRIWLSGPGTGDAWRDMTGWQAKNSWSWRTLACDVGENTIRAEVCDSSETWDDADVTGRQTDAAYEIT